MLVGRSLCVRARVGLLRHASTTSLRSFNASSSFSLSLSGSSCAQRGFHSQVGPLRSEISDFPGAQSRYTTDLHIDTEWEAHPVYRVIDAEGNVVKEGGNYEPDIPDEELVSMYKHMVELNTMDTIFYESQRQGRIRYDRYVSICCVMYVLCVCVRTLVCVCVCVCVCVVDR
jgi:hypothetical protein